MSLLGTKLSLGAHEAPSRVVFAAHRTNFAAHRRFEARHAAYYAARAAGGAGVIVLETVPVHASDWPYEYAPLATTEGLELVANAVHAHGALALASLGHSGGQGSSHYSQAPLWAPSAVPEVNSREVPMEMEPADIDTIVDAFARTAKVAIDGGLDGVEINIGQSSLLRQFLSPLTNRRNDDYGGALDNRLRFARRVIAAVRAAVGKQAVVGIRVCGDEYAPWAGLVPETAAEVAALLSREGVDFVSVTSGSIYSQHMTRAGLYAAPGYGAELAALVKAKVDAKVKVFAQGSIVDVAMAESLLAENKADAIEMTRAQIADPELVTKVRENRLAEIRPCVLCNQDCVVETVQNPKVSCIQNPSAGYEIEPEFGPLVPATKRLKVLIIGAGPAGMEAARIAALRGHHVLVCGDQIGGAVRIAAAAPGRARLGLVTDWLVAELERIGVSLNNESWFSDDDVKAAKADVVVRCTGAKAAPRRFIALDGTPPVTARDVLAGKVTKTGENRAIILDEAGDHAGMTTAEYLADNGWKVTVVTADFFVGQRLTATMELTPWNQRAAAKGIVFRPQTEVQRISGGRVEAVDVFSRAPITLEGDIVVDASYEVPREDFDALRAGDAVAPRRIGQAILEGRRIGCAL